jgi:hypothetical protein
MQSDSFVMYRRDGSMMTAGSLESIADTICKEFKLPKRSTAEVKAKEAKEQKEEKEDDSKLCLCKKIATFRCGGCKSVNYCSRLCQKNNWSQHKPTCLLSTKKDK